MDINHIRRLSRTYLEIACQKRADGNITGPSQNFPPASEQEDDEANHPSDLQAATAWVGFQRTLCTDEVSVSLDRSYDWDLRDAHCVGIIASCTVMRSVPCL